MESLIALRSIARATALRPLALVSGLAAATACATRPPAPPTPVAVQPDTVTLVVMGTTDVHGRLYNHDYYTGRETDHGLALLKPLIDSIRGVHGARALLFDSGDLLQGNPLGFVYARQRANEPNPIIRAMNLLAYDAAAIGNHEFNYGLAHLGRAVEQAEFPFVSANIFRAGTNQHAYTPYVLLPVITAAGDTVRVGVTGNTPPGVHVWDRDHVTGVLEFREVVSSVRDVVREMRAGGADVVVVLSHGGLEGTSYDTVTTRLPAENAAAELARQEPGIDVILLGHTHRELADTTINGVLLTQARNWGGSLAVASLHLAGGRGAWRVTRKSARVLRPAAGRAERAFMDSLRWEHERTVAYVNARIGSATEALPAREARVRDTPVIDFINEVQRRAAGADLSSTAAFQIDAGLPAGPISIADVAALYPYDNTLKAIRITGAQLRAYLEKSAEYYTGYPAPAGGTVTNFEVPGYNFDIVSGVDYTLDISRPVGQRVTALTRNGAPVRDADTFTLALNNYRQSGGGGYDMIAGAEVVYDRQEDIRELLINEVRTRGEIRPGDWFRESWRLLPAAAAQAALAEQTARDIRSRGPDARRMSVRVLTTNDFHGNLDPIRTPTGVMGGAAALATYFRMETEGFGGRGPVLLLDGGDVMQGTPVSTLLRGRSTVAYYNAVGYDAAAIGNHEFDWGPDTLRARMAQAEFPWLSANILVAGTDTTPSWIRGTTILERDGIRIGVIGLMTEELPEATMAQYIEGLEVADGADVMNRLVPRMRAQEVDFLVVVAHAGARCTPDMTECRDEMVDWLRRTHERPDLVVAGHTHEVVRTRVNGITLIEAGRWGTHYGVVDLVRVNADSVDAWIRGTPVPWTERVPADTTIAALVAAAHEEAGPRLARHVTTAAEEIPRGTGEHPLGRLIADAQRTATGAQIAFMNAGGVRAPINAGPVTWGDLFRVQPFGNLLVVAQLRGADVKAALEHALAPDNGGMRAFVSGMRAEFDPARPAGERVISMHLNDGTTIEPDAIYTVSVPDFLATGVGDGFAAFGRSVSQTPTGIVDLDALISYIEQLPKPIRAPTDVRVRAVGSTR